jgi:aquaporin Z
MMSPVHAEEVRSTVSKHWPEYAMEAALLGIFMMSACVFTVLLEHPASVVHTALPDPLLRRLVIGMAMGATAIALIYSPWGKQSGAHFNPSVTLTFLRLGKIAPRDALAYVVAQCLGAIAGVQLAKLVLGMSVADPAVSFAVTVPGPDGPAVAFGAELAISFLLMSAVLITSNSSYARFTGLFCGLLVANYITFEAPLSGMSMNPARTLGSAVAARVWTAWWIYFTAPPLGMLLAAEIYRAVRGAVGCAKLHHHNDKRCIFCTYQHNRSMVDAGVGVSSRRSS